jgi:hypothetical protein
MKTKGRGTSNDSPETKRVMTGRGLKPGVNEADTGSVVHTVRGYAVTGSYAGGGGNTSSRNNMVSANGSRKRAAGRGR